jgi:hypothetical protein
MYGWVIAFFALSCLGIAFFALSWLVIAFSALLLLVIYDTAGFVIFYSCMLGVVIIVGSLVIMQVSNAAWLRHKWSTLNDFLGTRSPAETCFVLLLLVAYALLVLGFFAFLAYCLLNGLTLVAVGVVGFLSYVVIYLESRPKTFEGPWFVWTSVRPRAIVLPRSRHIDRPRAS